MHPRCRHIGACWDLLEWFQAFQHKSNTSRIQFSNLFEKKNQIFWFPCCSTREDLSITYVGLILTKPGRFFSRHTETRGTDRIQFKFSHFGLPWGSTREDLSIDVSITNVGLILTKLWWYLFSGCGDRQTDRHGFGILLWKHVGTQKISTQSSN